MLSIASRLGSRVLLGAFVALPLIASPLRAQSFLGMPIERQQLPTFLQEYQHLARQINAGEPIRVAYLGGSITAGAGATFADLTSWRARLQHALRVEFETWSGQFTALNAGISDTGSHLAAYRYQRDITGQFGAPDLLFIEFTVNDRGLAHFGDEPTHESSVFRSLQSLVDQVRDANPNTAIMFVLGTSMEMLEEGNSVGRQLQSVREQYARFAASRHIPIVDIHLAFFESFHVLTPYLFRRSDTVHPSDYGHWIFSQKVLTTVLDLLERPYFEFPELEPLGSVRAFPEAPSFVNAGDIDYDVFDWRVEPVGENIVFQPIFARHDVLRAVHVGSELEYRFQGTSISLWFQKHFLRSGQSELANGRVNIYIDGELAHTLLADRNEPNNGEPSLGVYERIASGLTPDEMHVLRIELPPNQPLGRLNIALHGILVDSREGLHIGQSASATEVQ